MVQHNDQHPDHSIVISIRGLDLWCFSCDRFLGETQINAYEERLFRATVQAALLVDDIYQHRTDRHEIMMRLNKLQSKENDAQIGFNMCRHAKIAPIIVSDSLSYQGF